MGFPQQTGGYFMPTIPQPQRFFSPAQANIRGAQPRWPQQPRAGGVQAHMMAMGGGQFRGPRPGAPRINQPIGVPRSMSGQQMIPMMQARPGMSPQGLQQMPGAPRPQNFKYAPGVRNPSQVAAMSQAMSTQQQPQAAVLIQGQDPLTASMLAAAPPQEQKQLLGERLFPLIQRMFPDLAGKITGMLLEIDNSELLHMLEHNESLKGKVEEAVAVLQAHQTKPDGQ